MWRLEFSTALWHIYMSLGFKRLTHCIDTSEANFETWWWPSARAETCSLCNKYYTTLLVVFRLSTLHHLIRFSLYSTCNSSKELFIHWWSVHKNQWTEEQYMHSQFNVSIHSNWRQKPRSDNEKQQNNPGNAYITSQCQ